MSSDMFEDDNDQMLMDYAENAEKGVQIRDDTYLVSLIRYFGHEEFRPSQLDIRSIIEEKRDN
jgi:hypothetical protein